MDPDEQPAETDTQAQPAPVESPAPSDADPALGDEAGAGSAASDSYGYADDLVGDFTDSDVDLSHLTPTDDGEPDDEAELVTQVADDETGGTFTEDDE